MDFNPDNCAVCGHSLTPLFHQQYGNQCTWTNGVLACLCMTPTIPTREHYNTRL